MARSIAGRRDRFFSQGSDGQVNEDEGRALEIARNQSLIDLQQRNTSLPLFRQPGSAGGESSAVGRITAEGLEGVSVQQLAEGEAEEKEEEEEEEEEPFERRGRGRAMRRNLFATP